MADMLQTTSLSDSRRQMLPMKLALNSGFASELSERSPLTYTGPRGLVFGPRLRQRSMLH
jgi:hypothetical protein